VPEAAGDDLSQALKYLEEAESLLRDIDADLVAAQEVPVVAEEKDDIRRRVELLKFIATKTRRFPTKPPPTKTKPKQTAKDVAGKENSLTAPPLSDAQQLTREAAILVHEALDLSSRVPAKPAAPAGTNE